MTEWQNLHNNPAPENVELETKIDDADGCRNEQKLIFSDGRWWAPDRSIYVYYRPTHWRLAAAIRNMGGGDALDK